MMVINVGRLIDVDGCHDEAVSLLMSIMISLSMIMVVKAGSGTKVRANV
jgi:hypothetical protein